MKLMTNENKISILLHPSNTHLIADRSFIRTWNDFIRINALWRWRCMCFIFINSSLLWSIHVWLLCRCRFLGNKLNVLLLKFLFLKNLLKVSSEFFSNFTVGVAEKLTQSSSHTLEWYDVSWKSCDGEVKSMNKIWIKFRLQYLESFTTWFS